MATLLLKLLKKELPFEWKEEQQTTFEELKEKLSSTSILKFLDFTKMFEVHIDVSEFVVYGVFIQDRHPIAGENTLRVTKIIVMLYFFKGPMFKLQPCHYYDGFSQCFCILW
jgi:hypothetical protein